MATPEVRKTSLTAHAQEGSLGVRKGGDATAYSKCGHAPTGLCGGIHLNEKLRMHVGECPGTSQVWKKKQDNWPTVNKDLEGLSYISDLNHLFPALPIQDSPTVLWVCISALLLS